jgi:cytochrome c1
MRRLIVSLTLGLISSCSNDAQRDRAQHAKALIASHCAACHQVPGVAVATGRVGPSLAHIREQQMIAGYFSNNPGTLTQWIEHPQQLLPGNAMPDMGLSHEQVVTIVDYLYTME